MYETEGKKVITLITENPNGCRDTAKKALLVKGEFQVHVPNAISLNGDGINDQWRVKGLGIERYQFTIYNRWGGEVYQSNPDRPKPAWDGTYEDGNTQVPVGSYVYMLEVIDQSGRAHYYEGRVNVVE